MSSKSYLVRNVLASLRLQLSVSLGGPINFFFCLVSDACLVIALSRACEVVACLAERQTFGQLVSYLVNFSSASLTNTLDIYTCNLLDTKA